MTSRCFASLSVSAAAALCFGVTTAQPLAQEARTVEPPMQTLTGCLVEEAAFAHAEGLGAVRDADAASEVHLVLMNGRGADSGSGSYVLTGTRERDLVAHRHTRVEIRGTVEHSSVPPEGPARAPRSSAAPPVPPTGAAGITPPGAVAHEPGDAAAPLPQARSDEAADAGDSPGTPIGLSDLPRLNVVSYRAIGGECGETLRRAAVDRAESGAAARSAPAPSQAATPVPAAPLPGGRVTVDGCLVRQSDLRDTSSRAPQSEDVLMLTDARISGGVRALSGTGVPGAAPTGSGTGTVREPEQPARPRDAASAEAGLAFLLEEGTPDLHELVGRRVTIEGTLREAPVLPDRPSAHATTPAATLLVDSFRRAGDASCR